MTLSRARETEGLLDELRAAAQEGIEVVRSSPFRRAPRVHVRSMAELVGPARPGPAQHPRPRSVASLVSARLDETMPPDYLDLLDGLADATDEMARDLAANQPPYSAQPTLVGDRRGDRGRQSTR